MALIQYTNYALPVPPPRRLRAEEEAIRERARQDFENFWQRPARAWVNTPIHRTNVRIAELRRQFPAVKPKVRLPKVQDRPHILPFSKHDLQALWSWVKGRHVDMDDAFLR